MAGIEQIIEILNTLPINQLDDTWVKLSWEKDFVELDSFPKELRTDLQNNNYYIEYLLKLRSSLDYWIQKSENEVSFWTVLVETDISYRHLIAFLAFLVDAASKSKIGFVKRHAGLLASCNYFQLVSIAGSGASTLR